MDKGRVSGDDSINLRARVAKLARAKKSVKQCEAESERKHLCACMAGTAVETANQQASIPPSSSALHTDA